MADSVAKIADESAQRDRLPGIAGVHVHLTAAGLAGGKGDLVTEALDEPNHGPPVSRYSVSVT